MSKYVIVFAFLNNLCERFLVENLLWQQRIFLISKIIHITLFWSANTVVKGHGQGQKETKVDFWKEMWREQHYPTEAESSNYRGGEEIAWSFSAGRQTVTRKGCNAFILCLLGLII